MLLPLVWNNYTNAKERFAIRVEVVWHTTTGICWINPEEKYVLVENINVPGELWRLSDQSQLSVQWPTAMKCHENTSKQANNPGELKQNTNLCSEYDANHEDKEPRHSPGSVPWTGFNANCTPPQNRNLQGSRLQSAPLLILLCNTNQVLQHPTKAASDNI